MNDVDVAIVGSGPYALSLAAHMRAREVPYRVFGPAMHFWRTMPPGINLKSLAFATSIAVPERGYGFHEWCRRRGLEDKEPCSMESYAAYGMEIQERLVPDLEETEVRRVRSAGAHRFELTLATGEVLHAQNVISATGLSGLAYTPDVLTRLGDHVTHTFSLHSYQHSRARRWRSSVPGPRRSRPVLSCMKLEASRT